MWINTGLFVLQLFFVGPNREKQVTNLAKCLYVLLLSWILGGLHKMMSYHRHPSLPPVSFFIPTLILFLFLSLTQMQSH